MSFLFTEFDTNDRLGVTTPLVGLGLSLPTVGKITLTHAWLAGKVPTGCCVRTHGTVLIGLLE